MMMHQESTAQPCWKSHMREPWQCIFCVRHNHGNAFLRHSVRIYCRLRIPQFASLIYKAIGKKGGGNLEPWWEREYSKCGMEIELGFGFLIVDAFVVC
jgi:hypothetical protein